MLCNLCDADQNGRYLITLTQILCVSSRQAAPDPSVRVVARIVWLGGWISQRRSYDHFMQFRKSAERRAFIKRSMYTYTNASAQKHRPETVCCSYIISVVVHHCITIGLTTGDYVAVVTRTAISRTPCDSSFLLRCDRECVIRSEDGLLRKSRETVG